MSRSPITPEHAIEKIVETAIYGDDLPAMEAFYREVLGLEFISRLEGRHTFLRAGTSVLLLFRAEETLKGDLLTPHGTTGPGHFAMGIPTASLEVWRQRLMEHGVPIELETDWPRGGKSLYFRDPAGNSVELITRGLWGLSDGW
jgi:catechol 2,3-dioxygenase-like lactoylglutathione lyase family enzyme